MATDRSAELFSAFVDHLAATIEAVGGSTVTVVPGTGLTEPGWTATIAVTGALNGTARVTFDDPGTTALLHVVLGPDADTSENAVRDLLSELLNQALGALRVQSSCADLAVTLETVDRSASQPDQTACFSLMFGTSSVRIAAGGTLDVADAQTIATAQTTKPVPHASAPRADAPRGDGAAAEHLLPKNLDVVLDIELPLSVRFGSTLMSIRALSGLGPGSIVDMGRSPDDPVEILVCGRPIARAEVVIVGGNYGVRITDLTSAAERLRAMEGQL